MTPFQPATPVRDPELTPEALAERGNINVEQAAELLEKIVQDEFFLNDKYQVAKSVIQESNFGCPLIHLSIRRVDRESIHDWRDLQEIKNQLVGPECEAFELYPAESRLVDTANQYHLWAFPDPNWRVPVGWESRLVDDAPLGRARNRPFDKEA